MTMQYRKLGNTHHKVSVLGFGCWQLGKGTYWNSEKQKQSDINKLVCEALDLGINYFDTAEMYNGGNSESSLGIALEGRRDEVIIGTKISPSNCNPDEIEKHLDASLKRLRTSYIDIYMLHWPLNPKSVEHFTKDVSVINELPTVEKVFETLVALKNEGKIRHLGVSNHGVTQ
ncbi:MAG: aldo/keto reductase, partial [Candidatus Hodarchaeota archaeon]